MCSLKVGVLALQGDFVEHIRVLRQLNVQTTEVRLPIDLEGIQGLIIPGGESTVMGRALHDWGLWPVIHARVKQKILGVWGTCAGAILLAEQVPNLEIKGLKLLDITVERNAFGRQVDSFIAPVNLAILQPPLFKGIFIRSPKITAVGKSAEAIGWLADGTVVAVQQEQLLATAFHPELTQDTRLHEYFLNRLQVLEKS